MAHEKNGGNVALSPTGVTVWTVKHGDDTATTVLEELANTASLIAQNEWPAVTVPTTNRVLASITRAIALVARGQASTRMIERSLDVATEKLRDYMNADLAAREKKEATRAKLSSIQKARIAAAKRKAPAKLPAVHVTGKTVPSDLAKIPAATRKAVAATKAGK